MTMNDHRLHPRESRGGLVFPEHACAIITCADGRLLLELRPATAKHAPDTLACFGGKREGDEDADACILRELREELAWAPAHLVGAVDLWRGSRYIARFRGCALPADAVVRPYPGACAVRLPWSCLSALPLTPWHAAVLRAWAAGEPVVHLAVSQP
jgi:8-oxo-dGTP pyrophosphatase MutT (NUDIX family)